MFREQFSVPATHIAASMPLGMRNGETWQGLGLGRQAIVSRSALPRSRDLAIAFRMVRKVSYSGVRLCK